jgi:MATE family multidrug resistance protein
MNGPAAGVRSADDRAPALIRSDLAELLRLAGPVVVSRVGVMTMGLTDAVVVGRYSAVQLGYQALGWSLVSIVLVTAMGLLGGIQVMAARAIGEGRPRNAGAALRRGLVYAFWIGLVSMVLLLTAGPTTLSVSGISPDLAVGATAPMVVLALSLPVYCLSVAAGSWLEGLGRPRPVMVCMALANVVNLIVNLVLVPGAYGAPALGAQGASWATFVSRVFLTLIILAYVARMPDARSLGVFERPNSDRPREVEQRRIGYGNGASSLFEVGAFSAMTFIAGSLGALVVAGYTVMLNVVSFVFMFPLGLAIATAVLVGRAYGARNPAALNRAAFIGFSVTLSFGVVAVTTVLPAARLIATGYTSDPSTVSMGAAALALACVFLIPDALQVVVAQCLRARGDVVVPTFTHLASYVLVMAPLGWYLAIHLGWRISGIVWAIITASFLSAGLLLGRFWMLARQDQSAMSLGGTVLDQHAPT